MGDATLSSDMDAFLVTADNAAARTALGASTPGLPAWTYTAGAVGDGQFTADNASPVASTSITLSKILESGQPFVGLQTLPLGCIITLTSIGGVNAFSVTGVTDGLDTVAISVTAQSGASSWAGNYQLSSISPATVVGPLASTSDNLAAFNGTNGRAISDSGIPKADVSSAITLAGTAVQPAAIGEKITVDSGWTAPASVGSKSSLADYAGGGALAGVDAEADAALVAVVAWAQAMQTALAGKLIPNT